MSLPATPPAASPDAIDLTCRPSVELSKAAAGLRSLERKNAAATRLPPPSSMRSVFFSWLNPLLRLGLARPLQLEDVPAELLPEDFCSRALGDQLAAEWEVEEARADGRGSMWRALLRLHWRTFAAINALSVVYFTTRIGQTLLLRRFIQALSAADSGFSAMKWALAMGGSLVVETIMDTRFEDLARRMQERATLALRTLVFRKLLLLPDCGRGELSTLSDTDPSTASHVAFWLHRMYQLPLVIIACFYIIYGFVGSAVWGGVAMSALLVPFNVVITHGFDPVTERMRKLKEARMKLVSEMLAGILSVKLFNWESMLTERIAAVRRKEMKAIYKFQMLIAGIMSFILSGRTAMVVCTLALYSWAGNQLTTDVVIPLFFIYEVISWPLLDMPEALAILHSAATSMRRLTAFFRRPIVCPRDTLHMDGADDAPRLSSATLRWRPTESLDDDEEEEQDDASSGSSDGAADDDEAAAGAKPSCVAALCRALFTAGGDGDRMALLTDEATEEAAAAMGLPIIITDDAYGSEEGDDAAAGSGCKLATLRSLDLAVRPGELLAIVGRVGSGKSSLLSALLGEMELLSDTGAIHLPGDVAYVPQRAWIKNATVRDNILCGADMDELRYARTLRVCALLPDLEALPAGDATEIGERGITLSGGQKQRINVARAVYAQADIVLLDDPLSAVDAHVGEQLFSQAIMGELRGCTRLLVTHQLQFLPYVDRVLVMEEGTIRHCASYDELVAAGVNFHSLIPDDDDDDDDDGDGGDDGGECAVKEEAVDASALATTAVTGVVASSKHTTASFDERKLADIEDDAALAAALADIAKNAVTTGAGKLVDDEDRNTGRVPVSTYTRYIGSFSNSYAILFVLLPLLVLVSQAMPTLLEQWTAAWIASGGHSDNGLFMTVYLGGGVATALATLVRNVSWFHVACNGARRLHDQLLAGVLAAPIAFFHTTPMGRLLNRFSGDLVASDKDLPDLLSDLQLSSTWVVAVMVIISLNLPLFLVAMPIMIIPFYFVQRRYRASAREVQRLNSIATSPVQSHFTETLDGLASVRAYRMQQRETKRAYSLLDRAARLGMTSSALGSWLRMQLGLLHAVLTTVVGLLAAFGGASGRSVAFVVLGVQYAFDLGGSLNWGIRVLSWTERGMTRVQRVQRMAALQPEESKEQAAAAELVAAALPPVWPAAGALTFEDVQMRYRDGLPLTLRGLSFSIPAGSKVGIVGRTGAGKSSLLMALFRIVPLAAGRVTVDGVDAASLPLAYLRRRLAIIPQDAVMFTGSLRSNLDPHGDCTDAQLWDALHRTRLDAWAAEQAGGLDAAIEEGGRNLSVGQRQLLCMSRALLSKSKLLVMDEATASVDPETDAALQDAISSTFADCTVLIIAHRLPTIIHADRLLVLTQGRVAEYDTPAALLSRPGVFSSMVDETGPRSAAYLREAAGAKPLDSEAAAAASVVEQELARLEAEMGESALRELSARSAAVVA